MDQSAGEREKVPGTEGSSLEVFIRAGENIERLHPTIFGLLLVFLSWLVSRGSSLQLVLLSLIFFTDWLLIALLPMAGHSFGPAKPPTLLLAILRMPFALIPLPLWVVAQVSGPTLAICAFWVDPHAAGEPIGRTGH